MGTSLRRFMLNNLPVSYENPDSVYKLDKAIYRLKQAPRA